LRHSKILVTGSAGFIGFHLSKRLLDEGWQVVGLDNLNNYYDVQLKKDRLKILKGNNSFRFYEIDLSDRAKVSDLFKTEKLDYVVNLAAQAGVRYSLKDPYAYTSSNIDGFLNILEGCRHHAVKHLVYASTSSVYGANKNMPFSVSDNVDHPISLYAATKKANELMAHSYSALYNIPVSGLRFFTVYGPWGRPDMALFLFTKAILNGEPIDVYNYGKMSRDFTYVDDIVEGIFRLIPQIPVNDERWDAKNPDPSSSYAPYRLYNIGNNKPVGLMEFIAAIENELGKEAKKNLLPLQDGDVTETFANVDHLMDAVGFKPKTTIREGVRNFIDWYTDYYGISLR
jgi:UDP-glucuronate 4-epimerase